MWRCSRRELTDPENPDSMPRPGIDYGRLAETKAGRRSRTKIMTDDFMLLTVADYSAQALTADQRTDMESLIFPLLGLFGETGSLLSEVKKKHRDRASYRGYAGAVVEELGDVIWYLNAVAA